MKKKRLKYLVESAEWQNKALEQLLKQNGKTVNPNGNPPPKPPNG